LISRYCVRTGGACPAGRTGQGGMEPGVSPQDVLWAYQLVTVKERDAGLSVLFETGVRWLGDGQTYPNTTTRRIRHSRRSLGLPWSIWQRSCKGSTIGL